MIERSRESINIIIIQERISQRYHGIMDGMRLTGSIAVKMVQEGQVLVVVRVGLLAPKHSLELGLLRGWD